MSDRVENGASGEGEKRPGTALVPRPDVEPGGALVARPTAEDVHADPDADAANGSAADADRDAPVEPEPAEAPADGGAASETRAVDAEPEVVAAETLEPAPPEAALTARGARAAVVLAGVLGGAFDFGAPGRALGPGGWRLTQGPRIGVDGRSARPAFAAWRRERLAAFGSGPENWPDVAPDWVCEILDAADDAAAAEAQARAALYAAAGVSWLWLLDPEAGALECFEAGASGFVRLGAFYEGEEVAAPPFHTAPFPLSALWAD